MRAGSSHVLRIAVALAAVFLAAELLEAAPIEAVKGKRYRLTKEHGPWMIMVASFQEPPPERKIEGMTPEQAADQLVFELRKKGIPAYTFVQETLQDNIEAFDRTGQVRTRSFTAQQGSIVVLAGNYDGTDPDNKSGRVARDTLDIVKSYYPDFLREDDPQAPRKLDSAGNRIAGSLRRLKNGGVWRATAGQPRPLSGAFLTVNPLLSPEEVSARQRDPLIRKLNPDTPVSLLNNTGRYTLAVATFSGRATSSERKANAWEGSHLDEAAEDAWQLANRLREDEIEAWVFHDRYRSFVTVGSFSSPDDPRIPQAQQTYGAKYRPHPLTRQQVLIAEAMTLTDPKNPGGPPIKTWLFDPTPRLIEVPQSR